MVLFVNYKMYWYCKCHSTDFFVIQVHIYNCSFECYSWCSATTWLTSWGLPKIQVIEWRKPWLIWFYNVCTQWETLMLSRPPNFREGHHILTVSGSWATRNASYITFFLKVWPRALKPRATNIGHMVVIRTTTDSQHFQTLHVHLLCSWTSK